MSLSTRISGFGLWLLAGGCFDAAVPAMDSETSATTGSSTGTTEISTSTVTSSSADSTSDPANGTEAEGSDSMGSEGAGSDAGETSATTGDATGGSGSGSLSTGAGSESGGVTASGSSESGGGSDSGDAPPTFFDDFAREDSVDIGNDWMEKDSDVFRIVNEEVTAQVISASRRYYDQIVYRGPVVADIALRTEFRVSPIDGRNRPFLVARLSEESTVAGGFLEGYLFEPQPAAGEICLMRFAGAESIDDDVCVSFCEDPPTGGCLEIGERYRLTLEVTGELPVVLYGRIEQWVADSWTLLADVTWSDDAPQQIEGAGYWGFGAGATGAEVGNYRFDNFSAVYTD